MADLSGYSDDELMQMGGFNTVPKTENILHKAISSISPDIVGYSMAGGTAPQDIGGFLASKFMGQPQMVQGLMPQAESMRESGINQIQNPLLRGVADIASSPLTYAMPSEGLERVFETVGKIRKTLQLGKFVEETPLLQAAARGQIQGKYLSRVDEFEKDLGIITKNNPGTKYDLSDMVDKSIAASKYNPELASRIQQSPEFNQLVQNRIAHPTLPSEVDIEGFQNLRNSFGKGFNYGKGDSTVSDLLDEMRLRHAEPFPNEMGAMNQKYKDVINSYSVLKPYISESKMTGSIQKGFMNPEIRSRLQSMTEPDTYNDIINASKGYKLKKGFQENTKFLGKLGERIGEWTLLSGLFRKVMGK